MTEFVIAYDDGSGRMKRVGKPHPTPEEAMMDSGMKPGEAQWGVNPNQLLMVENNGSVTVLYVPKGTILLSEAEVFRLQGEIKRLTDEVKRLQALAAKGEEWNGNLAAARLSKKADEEYFPEQVVDYWGNR